MKRRNLLAGLATGALASNLAEAQTDSVSRRVGRPKMPLQLEDFQPKSMLKVPSTVVERSKFPVVDVHTHWSFSARTLDGLGLRFNSTPEELL
jgi:hypothetical protein